MSQSTEARATGHVDLKPSERRLALPDRAGISIYVTTSLSSSTCVSSDRVPAIIAERQRTFLSIFSEVHTLLERPFIYAFHTLRYLDPEQVPHAKGRT